MSARGAEGRAAGPVSALVRHAARGLAAARAGEAALVGASAGMLALCAALVSGSALARRDAWLAAGLCALLAAASWWLGLRRRPPQVARQLDRALGLEGALVTAFEVEGRGPTSGIGALLARRVAARLTPREALRRVLPHSLGLVALPFLAGALLALTGQRERARALPAAVQRLAGEVRVELGGLVDQGRRQGLELAPEELEQVLELARRAAELQAELERGRGSQAGVREALSELQEGVAELQAELPPGSELGRALEEVQERLDGARMAAGAPPSAAARGGPGASGEGEGSAPAGGALARTDAEGTMSRPQARPAAPTSPRPDAGQAGGRWWPDEESELVARWVELRRLAAAGSER